VKGRLAGRVHGVDLDIASEQKKGKQLDRAPGGRKVQGRDPVWSRRAHRSTEINKHLCTPDLAQGRRMQQRSPTHNCFTLFVLMVNEESVVWNDEKKKKKKKNR
jgi:hypothetical protein